VGAECYAFSGEPADVARRLYELPRDLVARDFYALLVQSGDMAGIHAFVRVRPGDREGLVAVWEGPSLDGTPERILALVLSGQTGPALREKVDALLKQGRDFTDLGMVPCPPTPRGAFGHPIRSYSSNATLRTFVVAL
jgi:hypothetical protein